MNDNPWYQLYAAGALRFANHYQQFVEAHSEDHESLSTELDNIAIAIDQYNSLAQWKGIIELVESIDRFLRTHGPWDHAVRFSQHALRAAEKVYTDHTDDVRLGLDVVRFQSSLALFYGLRGQYQDAERTMTEALDFAHQLDDAGALGMVLEFLGFLTEARGDDEEANGLYSHALEKIRQVGHLPSISMALAQLASTARRQGRLQQAIDLCKEKLDVDRRARDVVGMMETSNELALLADRVGAKELAQECRRSAFELAQRANEPALLMQSLIALAQDAYSQEDYETAYDRYSQALEQARALGDRSSISDLLRRMAFAADELGRDIQSLLEESLSISQELGDQTRSARSLIQLGEVYQEKKEYARAKACYQRALGELLDTGDSHVRALAWQQLGELAQVQEEWRQAQECYEKSLAILDELPDPETQALLLHQLGQVLFQRDQFAEARRRLETSMDVNERLGEKDAIAGTLHQLAWVAAEEGHFDEACRRCEQSIAILEEIGSPNVKTVQASLKEFRKQH